jgi:hypothetical protein
MTATPGFRSAYEAAFLAHLADPDEQTLYAAWELGREAIVSGLGVMDITEAHHQALLAGFRGSHDVFATTRAARDFMLESVSAFEMAGRGMTEAFDAAAAERRRAAIVRQLSSFFADASLSLRGNDSAHEILHLLTEQAHELVGAACCVATLSAGADLPQARAASYTEADAAWGATLALADLSPLEGRAGSDNEPPPIEVPGLSAPVRSWLAVELTTLDGRTIGCVHVFHHRARAFAAADEAVLMHLAQMASAALERTALYA